MNVYCPQERKNARKTEKRGKKNKIKIGHAHPNVNFFLLALFCETSKFE